MALWIITHIIIWLAPQVGKMKRILCSDWLPKRARWASLARSGLPTLVPQKRNSFGVIFWPYNKSFIDQACSVKMAGYWSSCPHAWSIRHNYLISLSLYLQVLAKFTFPIIISYSALGIDPFIFYRKKVLNSKKRKNDR